MLRRCLLGATILVAGLLALPVVAAADPPGPTDFLTEIVSPPIDGLEATIVGGDSFLMLSVAPGTTVEVAGYQGEPFVEFAPDGEVRENRASPSYHVSQSKDGSTGALPAGVSADAEPAWTVVATDGEYAWHDHRTHWMGGDPPGSPGDIVWRGEVPLVVDGTPRTLQVETTWLPRASAAPALVGGVVGLVLGVALLTGYRRVGVGVLVAAAGAGVVVGLVQYFSVPAVTAPEWTLWVLPATALGAAALALWQSGLVGAALQAVAGIELVLWALPRRSGLTAAILPTDAPHWLDRAASAGAGVVGLLAAGAALMSLISVVTRPPA